MRPDPYSGKRLGTWLAASSAVLLQAFAAERGDKTADKSQFTLFHATPNELMREMSTDRPDKTESPFTVDAGHFQLEADLVTYGHDHDKSGGGDTEVHSWTAGAVNLKMGLCNKVDLQLVIDSYHRITTRDRMAGTRVLQSGFGDITTRLKVNLWGNDGGNTAFGVMPFLKFPTSQDGIGNEAYEGGVIFPLSVTLPMGWDLGLMTEFDFLEDATGGRHYHADFINSITFSHDLVGKLGFYVEFFSEVSTEGNSPWVGTVDLGFTYGLTDNIQLDAGVNIGVTKSAEDVNPFLGVSWRF